MLRIAVRRVLPLSPLLFLRSFRVFSGGHPTGRMELPSSSVVLRQCFARSILCLRRLLRLMPRLTWGIMRGTSLACLAGLGDLWVCVIISCRWAPRLLPFAMPWRRVVGWWARSSTLLFLLSMIFPARLSFCGFITCWTRARSMRFISDPLPALSPRPSCRLFALIANHMEFSAPPRLSLGHALLMPPLGFLSVPRPLDLLVCLSNPGRALCIASLLGPEHAPSLQARRP